MVELRSTAPGQYQQTYGGDTLNTAVYMARLASPAALRVAYVTALGDDPFSDEMVAGWRRERIETDHVARLPGRLPGLYVIAADGSGERRFFYWRSAAAVRDMFRTPIADRLPALLRGSDLVYLSGNSVAILDQESRTRLLDLLRTARGGGARIAFDSNYRPVNWAGRDDARRWTGEILKSCDIALPTFDDEAALFGDGTPEATCARLLDLGVAEVAVKNGRSPCRIASNEWQEDIPAEPVDHPVDTTAAGDSFNAAYLEARLAGVSPPEAARRGHRLAATVIVHKGAIIPEGAMPRPWSREREAPVPA
jgi:2-dehydro-3-deoxygluconokinase